MKRTISVLISCCFVLAFARGQEQSSYQESTQAPLVQGISKKLLQTNMRTIIYPVKEYDALVKKSDRLLERLKKHNELARTGSMTEDQMQTMKRDLALTKALRLKIVNFLKQYPKDGDLIYRLGQRKPIKVDEQYVGLE